MSRHRISSSAFSTCAVLCALACSTRAHAQQISTRTPLAGDTQLAPAVGAQQKSDLARGGDQYLAVWEDARAARLASLATGVTNGLATNPLDIFAARLDASGNVLDPIPLVVANGSFNQENARVAWNGSQWLVVFESRRALTYTTTKGVYAVRVSAAGQVLDATPIVIDDDDAWDETLPTVASDGTNWAVVWSDVVNNQDGLQGALVNASGQVVSKRLIATGTFVFLPRNPSLAWAQDRYLLTADHYSSGAPLNQYDDVFGRFLDANLNALGGEFPICTSAGSQTHSIVTSDGASFYVAWDFQGPWGTPVALNGAIAVPGGVQLGLTGTTVFARACFDGASWLVSWPGQGIKLARIDAFGAQVGSTLTIEAPPTNGFSVTMPAVAGGAAAPGSALVAWTDQGVEDLFARTLDLGGSIGARFPLATGLPTQVLPDLDGDRAHGYLVACASEISNTRRIVALRVDALGQSLDPQPLELYSGAFEVGIPRVAWTGALWLVVWHVTPTPANGLTQPRVFGKRILADGTLLDVAPLDLMPGTAPDIASWNGTILAVSVEAPTTQTRFIRSTRIDAASGAVDTTLRTIGNTYATSPRVDAFGGTWLVTFNKSVSHDAAGIRVQAAFVDLAGVPGPAFDFAAATAREHEAVIAHVGDVALVTYADNNVDVWMRRIRSDGTFLDGPAGVALTSAANPQFAPGVGSDGRGWLVAWNDGRIHAPLEALVGDVFATRVDASGLVADPAGLPIATEAALPEGNPAIAGDDGSFLIATAEFDPQQGATRVFLRTADNSVPFVAFCAGDGLDPNVTSGCPCNNFGAQGRGCANSVDPNGATLGASGSIAVDPLSGTDTVVLSAAGMPASATAIYLQGDARTDALFGDGVRCIGGTLIRLRSKPSTNGQSQFPEPGEPSLSQRGQVAPGSGVVRYYQTHYRNAAASYCTPATFNITSGVQVTW